VNGTDVFVIHFRAHVVPRLQAQIPQIVREFLADERTYSEAYHTLWWFAWKRGAGLLSEELQDELSQFIHGALTDQIESIDARMEAMI
jgi:hypothetical protein